MARLPVTVIVPTRNLQLLTRAMQSLVRTHADPAAVDVIVVDDGLPQRPMLTPRLAYIEGVKPFCFATNVNRGMMAAADGHDVFLMNDDTFFVTPDALRGLSDCARQMPHAGIVTPVFARAERTPSQRLGHLDPAGGFWREADRYLTFAAAYVTRALIEKVGLLDERFVGYGYEDNDYCMRARMARFETGVLPSVVMGHGDDIGRASSTFRQHADLPERFRANRELFLRKWGQTIWGLNEEQCGSLIDFHAANF